MIASPAQRNEIATPAAPSAISRVDCWPNELEVLLLQAGLGEKDLAFAAWFSFCKRIDDIADLDDGCYRLFPLVAGNLQNFASDFPHKDRLTGVLRYTWTKNQKLFRQFVPLLEKLQMAGIDFLLLKGAALVELYRAQGGVRPMSDVDILLHPEDVASALKVLEALDCRPPHPISREKLQNLIRFRHELTVRTAGGESLDIHWYLLADGRHLEAEDLFWRDAVPCTLGKLTARTLHPADQLLHACLHGVQWNEVSPVRWLADAMILIRAGMDWRRVERQARQLERVQPVRDTILYLAKLGLRIPASVADHWRGLEVTRFEKVEGGYRALRPNSRQRTKQLTWSFLRLTKNLRITRKLREAPAYMRQIHHFRAYSRRVTFYLYLLNFEAIHALENFARAKRIKS